MNHLNYYYRYSWLHLIRPLTLTGTVSPIMAGFVLAYRRGSFNIGLLIMTLIASVFIQISINILNDYYDFKHGQDTDKWVRGKGSLSYQHLPISALILLFISLLLGIWLALTSTFWIVFAGAVGVFLGYLYSAGPKPLSSLGLGELLAALCLGVTPTVLSYVIQGHQIDWVIIVVSFPFVCLIASMILTNNIRDIKKDQGFRTTIPILFGKKRAMTFLRVLLLIPYMAIIMMVITNVLSIFGLLVIFSWPVAHKVISLLKRNTFSEDQQAMKWSSIHHMVFSILFIAVLFIL